MAPCRAQIVIVCGVLLFAASSGGVPIAKNGTEVLTTITPPPSEVLEASSPQPSTPKEIEKDAGKQRDNKETAVDQKTSTEKITSENESQATTEEDGKLNGNSTMRTNAVPSENENKVRKEDEEKRIETSTKVSGNKETVKKRKDSPPKNMPIALPQKGDNSIKGYIRPDGTYIVEDTAGMPCVMAYFKATLTIYYPTDRKKEKYTNTIVSPPDDVAVSGKCDRDSLIAVLSLTWEQGIFNVRFSFDDLTDSWFVDQFSFNFNTTMPAYSGADKEETVLLKSIEKKRFWQTSHARSFRCLLLHDVSLTDEDENYSATIHFDEARVQALTKTQNFKTPKHCIHRVHRDEMVPITVGASLVSLTGLTVIGYGIFRYFKVKKFQYGTME